ncbi:gag-pol polyprotein [Ceratocystis lukuohia]|uniref:Gag-pol polyprotein n=1 Tax=Ceratocystis lukuohia TaxID=2019550 RepID=A0ABR4M9W7_9PEZI
MRKEIQTLEPYGSWEMIPAQSAPRRPMNSKWVLKERQWNIQSEMCLPQGDSSSYGITRSDELEDIRPPTQMGFPTDHILKLKKAVYDPRSAPKRWQKTPNKHLMDIGFTPLKNDATIFFNGQTWITV